MLIDCVELLLLHGLAAVFEAIVGVDVRLHIGRHGSHFTFILLEF